MRAPHRPSTARAPWPTVATTLVSGALVLVVAARWPTSGALPFVGRVAELALAGCAAYLLDDAAAPLTSIAPQGLWRRRAPVLLTGIALIGGGWLAVLLSLGWRGVRPPALEATTELVVIGLVAVAAASLLIRLGDHEPGALTAPAVVLAGIALVIVEGIVSSPVFLTSDEVTPGRSAAWVAVGCAALLVVVGLTPDSRPRTAVPDVTTWRKRRTGVR